MILFKKISTRKFCDKNFPTNLGPVLDPDWMLRNPDSSKYLDTPGSGFSFSEKGSETLLLTNLNLPAFSLIFSFATFLNPLSPPFNPFYRMWGRLFSANTIS